jgi:hypothetical protein
MKILSYLLIAAAFIFTSCDKDDDCNTDNLSTIIVGEWDVVALVTLGTVEFRANGDLIDEGELFVSDSIGGVAVTEKRYEVESNTLINIIAETSIGEVQYDVEVTDIECDEVDISVPSIGISGSLRRN